MWHGKWTQWYHIGDSHRTGLLDSAIADYDSALRFNPQQAESLYGRGLVRLKKGDKMGGDADIAAAKAIRASIAEEFERYGVH